MMYRFTTFCPRCKEYNEAFSDSTEPPHVNCSECLMNRQVIIPLELVLTNEVMYRSERPKPPIAPVPSPSRD